MHAIYFASLRLLRQNNLCPVEIEMWGKAFYWKNTFTDVAHTKRDYDSFKRGGELPHYMLDFCNALLTQSLEKSICHTV